MSERCRFRLAALACGVLAAARLAASAGVPAGSTSPASATPWTPTAEAARVAAPRPKGAPNVPERWRQPGATASLAEVIGLALANNPATRAAWLEARAAAAHVGSETAAYYPAIDLDGQLLTAQQASLNGASSFRTTTVGPALALRWLLADLGGRRADVDEAREALFAANWTHNAVIQNVILAVTQAYYQYEGAKALLAAQMATVKESQTNLEAAEERRKAGVATIADVLQARTRRSQAVLTFQSVEGLIQTIRGSLATAVGVPANIPVDVEDLPVEVDVDKLPKDVDALIARAEARRPDLLAFRTLAEKEASHARSVRAEGLPTLMLDATLGRTYYGHPAGATYRDNGSASLLLKFPLFTGFANTYDRLEARFQADAARARAESAEQQVILQVWTSYYDLRTAAQRLRTSRDLLESAQQSNEVALGRYKAGVGSILDLLTAESALADARAQEVQARADWFTGAARLARDVGVLEPSLAAAIDETGREKESHGSAPKP